MKIPTEMILTAKEQSLLLRQSKELPVLDEDSEASSNSEQADKQLAASFDMDEY